MKALKFIAGMMLLVATLSQQMPSANAGLLTATMAYGLCQTGCNAVAGACYVAAGATFGTVTAGVGVPAAIVGCNVALGTCMAACAAALTVAPTP